MQKRELLAELLRQRAGRANSFHPLSYGQKALWYLYQQAPDSAAYNTAFTARITSVLNVSALRQALQNLVHRHPSLRSTFSTRSGDITAEVHRDHEIHFEQKHVSVRAEEDWKALVSADYRRPFNLEQGPVIRATLFTRAEADHVLLLAVHHIVCDAWSLWIMADEISDLYAETLTGQPSTLPAVTHDYADYVRWQSELLSGPAGQRLEKFWSAQLSGHLPVLTLPTDRPRPPARTWRGDSCFFELDLTLVRSLAGLAESQGVTQYVLLLGVFLVLLHRYSAQEEFTIGSPTSGRTEAEFAAVVGYFVNPVVLRADLRGNPRFSDFLPRLKQIVLAALAHQDYPFARIVEQSNVAHERSRTPLMDVLFVLQKRQLSVTPGEPSAETDLHFAPFTIPQMEGQFDLTLEMSEGGQAVIKYDTDLYHAATIARMATHFTTLLRAVVDEPAICISDLPLLPRQEQELLQAFNSTSSINVAACCLHQMFEAQAEGTPEATALVFGSTELTYKRLNAMANDLAFRLQQIGIRPEKLVGVCLERSAEMVVSLLAVLKAGGAYVPLDPAYPAERLAFTAHNAGLHAVLTSGDLHALMEEHVPGITCVPVSASDLSTDTDRNPVNGADLDNLAYVIYTSGSTGQPKGAMNTHRAIGNRLRWMQQEYRLRPGDRVLQKTPFSFDVSVWEFFWPLTVGACLVVAKPGGHKDPAYLTRIITDEQVTVLHFVPSMLRAFLEHGDMEACSSVQQIFCSGEALPPDLQENCQRRFKGRLHNLYGPTEAAVDVTYWECERDQIRQPVPIGRPISNTSIHILDRQLRPVPIGVPGELYIGGVNVGRGYVSRPDLTAERFVPDAFADQPGARMYKTGDLARWTPEGILEYLGRLDHQIKVRGFRVELQEIEARLHQHANIRNAVVIARADTNKDTVLTAFFVAVQQPPPSTSELRQLLLRTLPEYMVPAVFQELNALPLTASGKIDRLKLPNTELARPNLTARFVMPQSDTEKVIAEIWRETLGIPQVGIHDNFFDLGGHSLRMTRMVALLQERTGRSVSIVEAFEHPTVHSLAAHLSGTASDRREQGGVRAEVRMGQRLRVDEARAARQKHRAEPTQQPAPDTENRRR